MGVKSPSYARRTVAQWGKIVAHEINHAYWIELSQRGRDLWSPTWLVEGLACHIARNDIVEAVSRYGANEIKTYPVAHAVG